MLHGSSARVISTNIFMSAMWLTSMSHGSTKREEPLCGSEFRSGNLSLFSFVLMTVICLTRRGDDAFDDILPGKIHGLYFFVPARAHLAGTVAIMKEIVETVSDGVRLGFDDKTIPVVFDE